MQQPTKGLNVTKIPIDKSKYATGEVFLHKAVSRNDRETIDLLLSKGAGIEERDPAGYTPLHIAAALGNMELVRYFVEDLGADVNSRDYCERTPLHKAAASLKGDIVKYLIEHDADIDAIDIFGESPMFEAAYINRPNKIAKLLIANGASTTIQNNRGKKSKQIYQMIHK